MQHGGAFTGVVVAHGNQYAAVFRRPRHIGMAQRIARAVHPRPLAVPQTKDAVVFALAADLCLLRPPERGDGEILVQTVLKRHVRLRQQLLCALHLHINRTKRRAAIPGDQTSRVQPRSHITGLLHQHQTHQRLSPV